MAVYRAPAAGCPTEADLVDCVDDVCVSTPVNDANIAATITFNATHYIFQVGGASLGQAGVQTLFVEAGAASGRCCLSGGDCAVVTATRCAALGGMYGGDGTSCGGTYSTASGSNALEDIDATGTEVSFAQGDDDFTPVALPFAFRFYGREYNEISVCVNGQIVFDGAPYTFANTWTIPTHQVQANNYAAVLADDYQVPGSVAGGCGE
jgi:hypothetical protein